MDSYVVKLFDRDGAEHLLTYERIWDDWDAAAGWGETQVRERKASGFRIVTWERVKCPTCGLPVSVNPHPEAGKPSHLNIVGATWGCLPCAEKRANGRARMIAALRAFIDTNLEATDPDDDRMVACFEMMLRKIDELDEERRREFHSGD